MQAMTTNPEKTSSKNPNGGTRRNPGQTYYLSSEAGLSRNRAIEIRSMAGSRDGGWLVRFFFLGRKPRAKKDSWIEMEYMRSRCTTKDQALEYAREKVRRLEWHQ